MKLFLIFNCFLFLNTSAFSQQKTASPPVKIPIVSSAHTTFALNAEAQKARLKMSSDPSKANLEAWRDAIVKDLGIRQKVPSSRVSREAQEEVLLLLRAAKLGDLTEEDLSALSTVLGTLYVGHGGEFNQQLLTKALQDSRISLANKMVLAIHTMSVFRFHRDLAANDKILNETIKFLLRQKPGENADLRILPMIRGVAEGATSQHDIRWQFAYNSLYLSAQRIFKAETGVKLTALYLSHLNSLVGLARWEDAIKFADFLSQSLGPSLSVRERRSIFESQLLALISSNNKLALTLPERFLSENKGHKDWTSLDADTLKLRQAFAHIYIGDIDQAKNIIDAISAKSISAREFRLNLYRTRSRLNTYLAQWPQALADAQSNLLLEPSASTAIMSSWWDIFSLFVKDQISMQITGNEYQKFIKILKESPKATEHFWSVKPLAELAQILYNRNKVSDLEYLVGYAKEQYSTPHLKLYVPFFEAWRDLLGVNMLPLNKRTQKIKLIEGRIRRLQTLDRLLAKNLLDALKKIESTPVSKKENQK